MKISLIQSDIVWESPGANLKHFAQRLEAAAGDGADLAVFPEMSATGYSLRPERIAENSDGPIFRNFRTLAQKYRIAVCFGAATARTGRFYNSLFVIDAQGDLVYGYDKIHPFSFTGEDRLYRAGENTGAFRLDPAGPRISAVICYDLRFPELFTRTADAADLYLVIANWPAARAEHWKLLLRARALDSLAYVAGVNRIGAGGKLSYAGDSTIVDPWGEVLAAAGDEAVSIAAEIDPARVRAVREGFTLLDDRREFQVKPVRDPVRS